MGTYEILLGLTLVIILSYVFEIIAGKFKLPSILLLIGTGIGLKVMSDFLGWQTINLMTIIPVLGTVGLILIVFEGALEIDYTREKNSLIKNALINAAIGLVLHALLVTYAIHVFTNTSWHTALVNAIPFSVISSAIAIPSTVGMNQKSKEFIVYESSFSDILGIIFFNYALIYSSFSFQLVTSLVKELLFVGVMSVVFSLLLLYLLKSIKHHVKFILIIAVLILVYVLGKMLHVSSLILILFFGLFLNNMDQIPSDNFQKYFNYENFKKDFHFLHQITAEGVFLIKTFFFLLFGYIINPALLRDPQALLLGGIVLIFLYFIRWVLLKMTLKSTLPELLLAPRGLISVLLFLSIPTELQLPQIHLGLLFVVVLGTALVLGFRAFLATPGKPSGSH